MTFKKPIILLLFSLFHFSLLSQKQLIKEIEFFSQKMTHPDSVLAKFQKENDLVIGFAEYSEEWNTPPSYQLIARKNEKWTAYNYIIKSYVQVFIDSTGKEIPEPFFVVNSFSIPPGFIDSFLIVFKQKQIWKLKCDKTTDFRSIYCTHLINSKFDPCSIDDAMSVGSIIMTKDYINSSSFYAPDYYEYECCPGNHDRKRFLETIEPIKQLFVRLRQ